MHLQSRSKATPGYAADSSAISVIEMGLTFEVIINGILAVPLSVIVLSMEVD